MKKVLTGILIASLIIINLFMGIRLTGLEQELKAVNNNTSTKQPVATKQVSTTINSDVSEVYDQVVNSVVTVLNNPNGTGSGVVYKNTNNKSYIITNHHVVKDNQDLTVITNTGESIDAKLLGSDELADIALLEINKELPAMVIGDSSSDTVGEQVLAIGSPSGQNFSGSLSVGVISGKDRVLSVDTDGDLREDWEMVLTQIDAAINPGNSGGALVNMAGQLIGINTLKINDTTVEGMGFAIPVNEAISIANQIEKEGKVTRPFLGISAVSMEDIIIRARYFDLELPNVREGIYVTEVQPFSPADKAGLQAQDVITKMDEKPISNFREFRRVLYSYDENDSFTMTILRDQKEMTLTVNLTN